MDSNKRGTARLVVAGLLIVGCLHASTGHAQELVTDTAIVRPVAQRDNKISLQPIDLLFFGTIDIEYERAFGDYFSLAGGLHLNLWEPLEGDLPGYSVRVVPRVYPFGGALENLNFALRVDFHLVDTSGCEGDVCSQGGYAGFAVGPMVGYELISEGGFVLSLAVGAVYSMIGNPEWTLYAPALRFDNLDGEEPIDDDKVIPFVRVGIGVAL